MEHTSERKFGDLQMDERYKKLERTLKLASLRKGNSKVDESWPLPTSPSISSINADPFDSSTTIPSFHNSRVGSEVVSSSNNLMNMFLKRNGVNRDHKIATSSLKNFSKEGDCLDDRHLMPPPNFDPVYRASKKPKDTLTYNGTKSLTVSQNELGCSDIDSESPKKMLMQKDHRPYDSNGKYSYKFDPLQISADNFQNRKVRIFKKWRVLLNEDNQLIIRGTLECGMVARSKPVVRRITSTTVESIFKHLYHLQGNIVDDEYELPEYVRGKFFNGFPDDWENVCQVWRSFIQQGRMVTFRWPTPITDSDDDLKSEITDITLVDPKSPKDKTSSGNTFREMKLSSLDSECTRNVLHTRDKENLSSHKYRQSDSFTQTCDNFADTTARSLHRSVSMQTLRSRCGNDKENCKGQENVDANRFNGKGTENCLKDKLNVILNNLTDKNCPQECISKIIEIFDCLNYVVSYGSAKEDRTSTENAKTERDEHAMQDQSYETRNKSRNVTRENILCPNTVDNRIASPSSLLQQNKRTFREMIEDEDDKGSGSDSESKIYAGIPKISLERIMRQREALIRPCKRRTKKRSINSIKDTSREKQQTLNLPLASSEGSKERYVNAMKFKHSNGMNFYDSSVSILEDEGDHLGAPRRFDSTVPSVSSDAGKRIEFDTVKGELREKLNDLTKSKSMHEMQERFVRECFKKIQASSGHAPDSCEAINSEKERALETVPCTETRGPREKRNASANHDQAPLSSSHGTEGDAADSRDNRTRMAKPVVVSTVPVDIDATSIRVKRSSQKLKEQPGEDEKVGKSFCEVVKGKSVEQQAELSTRSSTVKKNNSDLPVNVQPVAEERGKTQSSNSKTSPRHANRLANDKKFKQLSAWTPRVVFDSGLHLIFEGRLLNEAGHVVHRSYKTDIVLRRVSPKVIETINHDFYQLVGDLNDRKHVVPKELINQCRYGCPIRIEQFCRAWNSLQGVDADTTRRAMDTSMDTINIGVSSKGRRIIPPLSYWTGERIVLKGNDAVYNPGNSQDSLSVAAYATSPEKTEPKNTARRKRTRSKKRPSNETENTTASSPETSSGKAADEPARTENRKSSKGLARKSKRRILERESGDSSYENDTATYKRARTKIDQQEAFNGAVNAAAKRDTRSRESGPGLDAIKSTARRPRAREGKDTSTPSSSPSKHPPGNAQTSTRIYRDVTCTYYQDIPAQDDVLSDDQVSHV